MLQLLLRLESLERFTRLFVDKLEVVLKATIAAILTPTNIYHLIFDWIEYAELVRPDEAGVVQDALPAVR